MATRGLNFLARPQEFLEIINKIINDLNLHAVLAKGIKDAKVQILPLPLQLDVITKLVSWDFFLTDKVVRNGILVSEICIPKEGWIQIVPPREEYLMLKEGYIAIKNDWYIGDDKFENQDSLMLFDKVKRMFKKHIKYPVFTYDVQSGHLSPCKIVGYTEGAKQFEREGGLLLQSTDDGFCSTRFAIDKNCVKTDPDLLIKRAEHRAKRVTSPRDRVV